MCRPITTTSPHLAPADLVGFTSMSKETEPATVISFINSLFSSFDKLVDQHAVHKVGS
jgi:class 3 adenylate cyclase